MGKPDLTEAEIAGLIERELRSRPLYLHHLPEGLDSQAFGFEQSGKRLVLRVRTTGEGFQKEAMLQRRLASPALPIPAVLAWGAAAPGLYFCISEHAVGVTLEEADETTVMATLDATIDVLAAIHKAAVDWTAGFGAFDAQGRAPFRTWREHLRALGAGAEQALVVVLGDDAQMLLRRYHALIRECPEERALVHRDFGSNNVLTDGVGITAVLDWDAAGCGDPLYDVGTALFWRTWLTCFDRLYERCRVRLGHLPAFAPRVLTYALAVGFAEVASSAAQGDDRQVNWDARRCIELLTRPDPGGCQVSSGP